MFGFFNSDVGVFFFCVIFCFWLDILESLNFLREVVVDGVLVLGFVGGVFNIKFDCFWFGVWKVEEFMVVNILLNNLGFVLILLV